MTYDFVVWDGPLPLSNAHASSDYQRLRSENPSSAGPTLRIRSVVEDLLRVFPDRDMPGGSLSPWIDTPLMKSARGNVLYLRVAEQDAASVRDLLVKATGPRSLVVFDPQRGSLVPSAVEVARTTKFQLPPPGGLNVHLSAVLGEEIESGRTMVTVLEHPDSCFYLQWLVERGTVVLEAQNESRIPMEHQLSPAARDQMMSLGFQAGDPNWHMYWPDGRQNLDDIVKVIDRVFYEVRKAQPGQAISANSFPVPVRSTFR